MSYLEIMQRDGCVEIAPMATRVIAEIDAFLLTKQVHNGHVVVHSSQSLPLKEAFARDDWPMFCHAMDDVVAAPHLFERALSMFEFACLYFQGPACLYSINAFWTQPSAVNYPYTHQWHRDSDCKKQLVLFVYGRDVVAPDNGAHLYQRGSHLKNDSELGYSMFDPSSDVVTTFVGTAGTSFMVDTGGVHMGVRPRENKRLLLWARWGNEPLPASYVWDKLRPAPRALLGDRYPTDHVLQEAVRLVVC